MTVAHLNSTNLGAKNTTHEQHHADLTNAINSLVVSGGATVYQTDPVAVSSAEIKALKSSPKEIIAAPGAGIAIIPASAAFSYTAGGTGYTTSGHLMLTTQALIDDNPDGTLSLLELNSFTATLGTTSLVFTMNDTGNSDITYPQVTRAQVANQALKLYANGANPTLGTGTMTVQVWYTLATV